MTNRDQEETLVEGVSEGEVLAARAEEEKCIKSFAVIVERLVRFLSSQQEVNQFIAESVLEKAVAEPIQKGFKTEVQESPITNSLR